MNKYLIILAIAGLVVVAISNGGSKEKTQWGKTDTEPLVSEVLIARDPAPDNDSDNDNKEITFKCRKVGRGDNAADDSSLSAPLKTDE